MSLGVKTRKGHDYLVFTGGRGNELHLGPANDPSKINSDRVLEALEYVKGRNVHYSEIEDKLVSFLPPEKKDQYLSKRIEELYKIADKHISSLSDPELKRQYSGDRTKVRPQISMTDYVEIISGQGFARQLIKYLKPKDLYDIATGKKNNVLYKFSKETMLSILEKENLIEDILGFAMKHSKEKGDKDLVDHFKKRFSKNAQS